MEDVVEEERLTPRFSRVLKTKLELSIQKQYKATWDGCSSPKFAPYQFPSSPGRVVATPIFHPVAPLQSLSRNNSHLHNPNNTWSGGCNPDISSGWSAPKFSPSSHEAQATPLAVGRSASARFAPVKKITLIDSKGELEGRVMR